MDGVYVTKVESKNLHVVQLVVVDDTDAKVNVVEHEDDEA